MTLVERAKTAASRLTAAVARRAGWAVVSPNDARLEPPDLEADFLELHRSVDPFTMTSVERVYCLHQAVKYLVRSGIEGAIVECGVWRGGSMMAVAKTLLALEATDRELFLLDTYSGMSEPTGKDVSYRGAPAVPKWIASRSEETSSWCYASVQEVRSNMISTGYPAARVHFVEGKVEDTIPAQAPAQIALLRLDTDWFESTYHSLKHLFPRLAGGGVLILDDYGHWQGAREAADRYIAETGARLFLVRVDYTCRVAVKGCR